MKVVANAFVNRNQIFFKGSSDNSNDNFSLSIANLKGNKKRGKLE